MDNAQDVLNRVFTLPVESALDTTDFALAMGISLFFGLILHQLYNLYFQDNEPQVLDFAREPPPISRGLTPLPAADRRDALM